MIENSKFFFILATMKIDSNNCAESPRSSVLLGTSETPYQSLVDLREDSATPPGRGVISPKPGVLNLSSFMHIDTTEEYGSYELGLEILLLKYILCNLTDTGPKKSSP